MRSTSTIAAVIARPPADVFDALTRLGALGDQLGRSGTYRGTVDVSDDPVRVGSTYVDRTPLGRLRGAVLEMETNRRVVFRQATDGETLAVRITYELEPAKPGTRLLRTGEISTRGLLALAHPIVVLSTRAENRRTMAALKASLER